MNEKELMEQLKAGILKGKMEAQARAEREAAEQLERDKAEEKRRRIEMRTHREAMELDPLVAQLLKGWYHHSYTTQAKRLCEIFKLDVRYVRDSGRDTSYHVSRALIELEEPNPLTKLKEVMDSIDEQLAVKFIDEDIVVVGNAKEMLEECEKELEDDKLSLTPWLVILGLLSLYVCVIE